MRRVALYLTVVMLAACGGDAPGFYDGEARELASRAARDRLEPKEWKPSLGSVKERRKCPQAPSPEAGPCVNVELKSEIEARPVTGGAPVGTMMTTIDAFVWLAKRGAGWKVTYVTYRPRAVSLDGVPYTPSP